jgi:DUF4097 and DUF4098 domain-containing protein YvlB
MPKEHCVILVRVFHGTINFSFLSSLLLSTEVNRGTYKLENGSNSDFLTDPKANKG